MLKSFWQIILRFVALTIRAIAKVEDEIDLEAIRSAKIEIEREGTVSWEALRAELSL
jgi:hypothetical protein